MTAPLAVVSGGTRGIGLAFSTRLVALGHRVVGLYHSDEEAARQAHAKLGDTFWPVRLDVADAADVERVTARIVAEHGGPTVLVNNAGRNIDRPLLEMSTKDWDRVLGTNLDGPFYLTRALAPAMLAQAGAGPGSVIVNVGATTGIRPRLNGVNYCASKAGLLQLTKCLALELAPRIRVNCLIPGMTWTDELVGRFNLDDPQARAAVLTEIPQGRIASTDDIADALEFLVGAGSAYLTGQKLIVDGGQFMW
ncbi:SDR family oxidoreductase [Micromonospora sp. NPDC048170]|uniref:SDR family NAD(P)-dependent oxidoreductase n=1 Tax=Micromonospora sp. NPDC048170 TaxID=3154819 RepID=UPI0033E1CD9B